MKVLVTGGAGFIGSHVVRALASRGDDVVVLDNFDDAYDPAIKHRNLDGLDVRVVQGDVRDGDLVASLLPGAECVVHMAARAGVRESLHDPLPYQKVNVGGTAALLDAVRRQAGTRVVFASSSSLYGALDDGPFHEDLPADRPESPYAATKRAGELLCHAAWKDWDVPVTCLRFFTVYGPRQRPTMAIARFVRMNLEGLPVTLYGDGSSARDYTWAGDATAAILSAVSRPLGFSIINVGSGSPVRLDELVRAVARACGRPVRVEHHPEQPGDVPLTFADNRRARKLLDWTPTVGIDEGLRRYVDWYAEVVR